MILQGGFEKILKSLKGEAKIRPQHIEAALAELKTSLLEADVHLSVVKTFLERVKQRAVGQKVLEGLNPYQQFLLVLRDEILEILGKETEFNLQYRPPVIVLMAGLQGAGKTTSAAKLALFAKRKLKRNPLLVSTDIRRPAAIEQLERLGKDMKVDVFATPSMIVKERAEKALEYARTYGMDLLIVDTAGRLSIDQELMEELSELKNLLQPQHILYVADAMSGQGGLEVAEGFAAQVHFTGVILTKTDADARGGVSLSIRERMKAPLLFVGSGEKAEEFEPFHPDRWVSRILGMGDLKSLVEKVEELHSDSKNREDQEKVARKALKGQLSLMDFQSQLKMLSKMGSMKGLLGMVPGMGQIANKIDSEALEKRFKRIDAMINSMTPHERLNPDILSGGRKRRVAVGSGTSVEELNQFLKEFWQMQKMMKGLKGKGLGRLF